MRRSTKSYVCVFSDIESHCEDGGLAMQVTRASSASRASRADRAGRASTPVTQGRSKARAAQEQGARKVRAGHAQGTRKAGARQQHGRSRAGAGQEQGKSRVYKCGNKHAQNATHFSAEKLRARHCNARQTITRDMQPNKLKKKTKELNARNKPAGGNKNLWPQRVFRMPMKTPTFECTKHKKQNKQSMYLGHVPHIQSVKLFRDQQAATKTYDLNMSFACIWKRQRFNVRNIHKPAQKTMHLGHMSHIQSVKLFRHQQTATKTYDLKMSFACLWKRQRLNVRNIHCSPTVHQLSTDCSPAVHHWHSLAITGHHWPSLAFTGHHWPSLAVTGQKWNNKSSNKWSNKWSNRCSNKRKKWIKKWSKKWSEKLNQT